MRLKRLENQWRVWMNPNDYQALLDHAHDYTAELAIRYGAEVGLRVSETANVKVAHIRNSTHPEVNERFIGVYGKDTTGKLGDMGKFRDAFIPNGLYEETLFHSFDKEIPADQEQFPVTKRTVQEWIKRAAETAAEETGNEDFAKVSSHDLRAYFATNCLIRHDMNLRVIMEVGGWNDYKSMQPYLNAMFDDVIAKEFVDAGLA